MNTLRGATAVFATTILALAIVTACSSEAQEIEDKPTVGWLGQDYFLKETDPSVQLLIKNVEDWHLQKKFKDQPGALQYSEGDMLYTLKVFPNHPKALHILSAMAIQTNNLSLPIPFFEKALRLFPHRAYTHAQYGHYLVLIGGTAVGIRELELALQINPDLEIAQAWLAEATHERSAGPHAP